MSTRTTCKEINNLRNGSSQTSRNRKEHIKVSQKLCSSFSLIAVVRLTLSATGTTDSQQVVLLGH